MTFRKKTMFSRFFLLFASFILLTGCGRDNKKESEDESSIDSLKGPKYYVASNGSNSNPGTESLPWLTIQYASDNVVPGDNIVIKEGIYNERISPGKSGESGKPITFWADGNVNVLKGFLINKSWIVIDGINISSSGVQGYDGAFQFKSSASYCTVKNSRVYNLTTPHARVVLVEPSLTQTDSNTMAHHLVFRNITIESPPEVPFIIRGHDNLIEKCTVTNPSGDFFYLFGYNHVVRGNILKDAPDSEIYHVDLFQTFDSRQGEAGLKNVIIENNICLNNQAQICNLEGNAANGYSEISDIIFRNNIFANIYYQANCYAAKCKWYNNTFYKCSIGPGAFSHVLLIAGPMSEIKNNLFIECGSSGAFTTYGFYVIDALATGSIADYNYVAGRNNFDSKTNFTEVHGINGGDPKFVNIAKNNFRLLLGSNAIDKGTTINGLNTDIEGTQRPKGNANDIGAYEFK